MWNIRMLSVHVSEWLNCSYFIIKLQFPSEYRFCCSLSVKWITAAWHFTSFVVRYLFLLEWSNALYNILCLLKIFLRETCYNIREKYFNNMAIIKQFSEPISPDIFALIYKYLEPCSHCLNSIIEEVLGKETVDLILK